MYYQTIDHEKQELTLSLSRQDIDDLAYACTLGEIAARGKGPDNDPALAHRLNLMLVTFMVAFEAVKPRRVEVIGGANGT